MGANQSKIIKEKLEKAHITGILTLSRYRLRELPPAVRDPLTSTLGPLLKTLDLSQNQFQQIPIDIFYYPTQLKLLFFNNNQLQSLPDPAISTKLQSGSWLPKLERFDVQNNQIQEIPATLFQYHLQQLKELHLAHNQLKSLPESLKFLRHLTVLNVSGNQLGQLPVECWRGLEKLESLDLSRNQLLVIPDALGDSSNLCELKIHGNTRLASLPSTIFTQTRLMHLQVMEDPKVGTRMGVTDTGMTLTELQSIEGYDEFEKRRKGRRDQLLK